MNPIHTPYPVSANRYWRIQSGRPVRSTEAATYKRAVLAAAVGAGWSRPLAGDVAVTIRLRPRMTKAGAASRVRVDLDNAAKVTLDALQGICMRDDAQVVRLLIELDEPLEGGGMVVTVCQLHEMEV